MSAAWDASTVVPFDAKRCKRLIRLWIYLSVAGAFLLFVYSRLGINLF